MDLTLTVLDTAGIQDYIFGSNELRENIGASELAYRATTYWVFEQLDRRGEKHNVTVRWRPLRRGEEGPGPERKGLENGWEYDDERRIEDTGSGLTAEVIYAGGGNMVILFGGAGHAQRACDFVYDLSRFLLTAAPGLTLYAAHVPYTWGDAKLSLPAAVQRANRRLTELKTELPPSAPTLGLSVTAACVSTGLPANDTHPNEDKQNSLANLGSSQVKVKWQASAWAKRRLRGLLPNVEDAGFRWSDDLDNIGDLPGWNESYIAVVHADNNGMGRRIIEIAKCHEANHSTEPRLYMQEMRDFSRAADKNARTALQETVKALVGRLKQLDEQDQQERRGYRPPYFPFRPVVFGGDDVTWVCAGPWGLSLAQRYLSEVERQGEFACAGVAIVKSHYPISRAYRVSEELMDEAKDQAKELDPKEKQVSALDWHFTTTGLSGALEEIRRQEYRTTPQPGDAKRLLLNARPLTLRPDYGWRNWDNFERVLLHLLHHPDWRDKRNKVAALREALRHGPVAVRQFFTIYKAPPLPINGAEDGWLDGEERCAYFDAVELASHYLELAPPVANEQPAATEEVQ